MSFHYQMGQWSAEVSSHIGAFHRHLVIPVVCLQGEDVANSLEVLSRYPSWQHQRWIHVLDRNVCPILGEVVYMGKLGLKGGGLVGPDGRVFLGSNTGVESEDGDDSSAGRDGRSPKRAMEAFEESIRALECNVRATCQSLRASSPINVRSSDRVTRTPAAARSSSPKRAMEAFEESIRDLKSDAMRMRATCQSLRASSPINVKRSDRATRTPAAARSSSPDRYDRDDRDDRDSPPTARAPREPSSIENRSQATAGSSPFSWLISTVSSFLGLGTRQESLAANQPQERPSKTPSGGEAGPSKESQKAETTPGKSSSQPSGAPHQEATVDTGVPEQRGKEPSSLSQGSTRNERNIDELERNRAQTHTFAAERREELEKVKAANQRLTEIDAELKKNPNDKELQKKRKIEQQQLKDFLEESPVYQQVLKHIMDEESARQRAAKNAKESLGQAFTGMEYNRIADYDASQWNAQAATCAKSRDKFQEMVGLPSGRPPLMAQAGAVIKGAGQSVADTVKTVVDISTFAYKVAASAVMWEDRVGFKEFWGQVCDAFCSSSKLPEETPEEYAARQKALEDAQEWQNIYRRAVDGHNCQLADTQQQGRLLGHGVQLFAGPKLFEALTKVAGRIGGAALRRGQAASTAATGAKAAQAADKGKGVVQADQTASTAANVAAKKKQAASEVLAESAKAGELTVQFGKDSNQIYHTFRHTDILGLDRTVVKSAIETHLAKVSSQIAPGRPFNQIIEIAGQRVQYTAFKLEDGTIHIGRIHGIK